MVQTLPLALNYWAGNQFVPAPVNWAPTPKPAYAAAMEQSPQVSAPQPTPTNPLGRNDGGGSGYGGQQSAAGGPQMGSYNAGLAGGVLGSLAPVPGVGALTGLAGTAYDTSRVNRDLNSLGLKGDLGLARAALGNATFGLLGESPQAYWDLMTAGVPASALQAIVSRAGYGPPINLTPQIGTGLQSSGSASQDYFGSINDMNNVGRLGDVLNELDASRENGTGSGFGGGHSSTGGGSGVSAPDQDGNDSGLYSKGGKVTTLFGPNPPGPDDGYGGLDKGEHVVKASEAKKHRGLLNAINKGASKKKLRGLLGG